MGYPSLNPVSGQWLLENPINAPRWVVENLIPCGLTLFVAPPKTGKSWGMLSLCIAVSLGSDFLGFKAMKGAALYLSLEDTYQRVQSRLQRLVDEIGELDVQHQILPIDQGFKEQIEDYLTTHPTTNLIVIDTFQMVRSPSNQNVYASDYHDMSVIKRIADSHEIAIVVVHHTRKCADGNIFNMVSGSNGLMGAADETIVITPEAGGSGVCRFDVTGRDVELMQIKAKLDGGLWMLIECIGREEIQRRELPDSVTAAVAFFESLDACVWKGTASDLATLIGHPDIQPNVLSKKLNEHRSYLAEQGITYKLTRTANARVLDVSISRNNDGGDDNDG